MKPNVSAGGAILRADLVGRIEGRLGWEDVSCCGAVVESADSPVIVLVCNEMAGMESLLLGVCVVKLTRMCRFPGVLWRFCVAELEDDIIVSWICGIRDERQETRDERQETKRQRAAAIQNKDKRQRHTECACYEKRERC